MEIEKTLDIVLTVYQFFYGFECIARLLEPIPFDFDYDKNSLGMFCF